MRAIAWLRDGGLPVAHAPYAVQTLKEIAMPMDFARKLACLALLAGGIITALAVDGYVNSATAGNATQHYGRACSGTSDCSGNLACRNYGGPLDKRCQCPTSENGSYKKRRLSIFSASLFPDNECGRFVEICAGIGAPPSHRHCPEGAKLGDKCTGGSC